MNTNNYTYGLKIKDKIVEVGDTIKITKADGNSTLSYLFRQKIVDEVIVNFVKHEKYNTFMLNATLFKNSQRITYGERFELTQERTAEIPEKANKPYESPLFEINIAFAEEMEQSDAEYI